MYERIKVTTSNYVDILQSYKNYKLKSIKINLVPKENLEFANDILKIFSANKVEIIIDNNLSIQDVILSLEIPLNANIGTITECRNYLYEQSSLYSFLHSNHPPITNSSDFLFKYKRQPTQSKENYGFEKVWEFNEDLCAVKQNEKFGFIDTNGKIIIPIKYDYALSFSEGLANVGLNEKYGFIDKDEKIVIPFEYDFAFEFQDGLAKVEKNGLWGYIDKTGKEIIPIQYENIGFFEDGVCHFQIDEEDKYGLFNTKGEVLTPCIYKEIDNFYNSLAKVKRNNKWGFIDNKGQEIVNCEFDYVANFSENLALVKINEKYGYIDKTGKFVIPPIYDLAFNFFNGIARVKKDGKYGFINHSGSEVLPFEYTKIIQRFLNCYPIKKGNKWGLTDLLGKIVLPCEYDNIEYEVENKKIRLKKDDKYTYIDEI